MVLGCVLRMCSGSSTSKTLSPCRRARTMMDPAKLCRNPVTPRNRSDRGFAPNCGRGLLQPSAKYGPHVFLMLESRSLGDFGDGQVGSLQELARPGQPNPNDLVVDAASEKRAEPPLQHAAGHGHFIDDVFHADLFAAVLANESERLRHRAVFDGQGVSR